MAYQVGPPATAYVEPVAVGAALPPMPLFLRGDSHVRVPLAESYDAAWAVQPEVIRRHVAG